MRLPLDAIVSNENNKNKYIITQIEEWHLLSLYGP